MGTKVDFICPSCGYTAMVSGGRDVGMEAVVQTMTCEDCQTLVDVLIGRFGEDGPTGDANYDQDLNLCPQCRGTKVHPWPSQQPCPKCSGSMIEDENGLTIAWD